jgi:N-acetylglutamate synthase-like GNAT family acetyltransferase
MNVSNWQLRRATLDDLVVLRRLWQQQGWPASDLEKHFTEFQVVETATGELQGAIGLAVDGAFGQIHSEAYADPALVESLRPRLWERVQSLARNHGLTRLWIDDVSSAFWLEKGFEPAAQELIQRVPTTWAKRGAGPWLTLKLRDEAAEGSVDHELEVLAQFQLQERERLTDQARRLRLLAVVVVGAVLLMMAWAGWSILTHMQKRRQR